MTAALAQCGADILLITEPWWQDIGDGNTISVAGGNYTCLLPMQAIPATRFVLDDIILRANLVKSHLI